MKSYRRGIIVGILMVVAPVLFMGFSNPDYKYNEGVGVFEFHINKNINHQDSQGILLNTITGETWYIRNKNITKHEK